VRPHGCRSYVGWIDQRRQRHGTFDRRVKLNAKFAHEIQVRPEARCNNQFVDDNMTSAAGSAGATMR